MEKQPNKNTSKDRVFLERNSKQPASNLKPSPNNPPTKLAPVTPKTDSGSTSKPTKK